MPSQPIVIASGNLATARRTIMGILGQCALLDISDSEAAAILTGAGLPARALEEVDFPISLEQELLVMHPLAEQLEGQHSPAYTLFSNLEKLGLESLGVLGIAMRHASTAIEALQTCFTHPQLVWGHCRLVASQQAGQFKFSFTMERPQLRDVSAAQLDTLVEYCQTLDLVTSLRFVTELLEAGTQPLYVRFAFAQPPDWGELKTLPPCLVYFNAGENSYAYPSELNNAPLPRANPLLYRSFMAIAEKQSQMLAEELSVTERVSRWLWAYTPPPKRAEIASLLHLSERSLTRHLQHEGSAFSALLAQVQEERAKNFLRNGALSVSEISDRLGYAEAAVFSRAFSRWTGVSPLKWRADLQA